MWRIGTGVLAIKKSTDEMRVHMKEVNGTVADLVAGRIDADKAAEYLRGLVEGKKEVTWIS